MVAAIFKFNNATGSDSLASGAGPTTSLFGSSASYSGSVFTLNGAPDLTGVLTDGSHSIWVQTSTGRQFFIITAKDNTAKTVTVESAPAGTASGLTWAIGGKRKTLDETSSRKIGTDAKGSEWVIELEDDQTLTASAYVTIGTGLTAAITIRSNVAGTLRTVTQSADAAVFDAQAGALSQSQVYLKDLKLQNTAGTKTNAVAVAASNGAFISAVGCVFGDAANKIKTFTTSGNIALCNCEVAHCTADGVSVTSRRVVLKDCWIHDNTSRGVDTNNTQNGISGCIIEANGSDGIYGRSNDTLLVVNNTIDNNGGDGIDLSLVTWSLLGIVANNNITRNAHYGIRGGGTQMLGPLNPSYHNNFGTGATANTLGDVLTFTKGPGSLAVDPQYANTASDNWSVGENVKAAGIPASFVGVNSATRSYVDVGASQREEVAGGGGSTLIVVED